MTINAQYNIAKPGSLPVKVAGHQRRKMFEKFIKVSHIEASDTILDIGATSDTSYDHSNYLEAWYPYKNRVTAVGLDNAVSVELLYPGVRFVRANGRNLPFGNGTFDFVHSSAVLEHVGKRDQQAQFLHEAWRVARRAIFITTPNRRFPIEFHTVLPLIHWLPPKLYRKFLVVLGHEFFAKEDNLNLLSSRSLSETAVAAGILHFHIGSVSLIGLATNLILVVRKDDD